MPFAPDSRTNPAIARQIIERLLPDAPQRREALSLLADLIEETNASPQNWGITLHSTELGLNVGGGFYTFWLRPGKLRLFWFGQPANEPAGAANAFSRFEQSRYAEAPIATALSWVPAIRSHMGELIRYTNERSRVLQAPSRQAHSPGVLRYLEEELGRSLPDPVYPPSSTDLDDSILLPPIMSMPETSLNTILYGPPGTGKTYRTARTAVTIIDGDAPSDRSMLMTRYKAWERAGQITFVTFHQSYSYEDFVEGIRPTMPEDGEGGDGADASAVSYRISPGVLKRMATDALFALLEPLRAEDIGDGEANNVAVSVNFDALWATFLDRVDSDPEREYEVHNRARYRIRRSERGGVRGINVATGHDRWSYQCGKPNARKVWDALKDRPHATPQDVEAVLQVGAHYTFIAAVLQELQKLRPLIPEVESATAIAPPRPLSAADREERVLEFLANGEASGYRMIPDAAQWPRFVLIVDEINRGNISKILGELITLLEEDKRVGALNEQIVTLPYSRQKFALPPNLYLLGTMNTADKSIALVDVALRRRFDFEELRPDFSPATCPELTEEMRPLLIELNRRISLRKDRDHRIGHAYFVLVTDPESFNRTFHRKIVPLLGEYFYGDWEGLRWVLNEKSDTDGKSGFVRRIPGSGDSRTTRNQWQWYLDAEDAGDFDPLSTLSKNYAFLTGAAAADVE